jgi:hypothetical protein
MKDKEWKQYVETGYMPMKVLKSIARLIKKGDALNTRCIAVYQTHAQIIELLLSKISKTK